MEGSELFHHNFRVWFMRKKKKRQVLYIDEYMILKHSFIKRETLAI